MAIAKEVEIKCLLGEEKNALAFREKLTHRYPDAKILPKTSQLNHYFINGEFQTLKEKIAPFLSAEQNENLTEIIEKGNNFSLRTREVDGKVLLVVKASLGTDTSANGVSRMEFEEAVNMTLAELDKLLEDAGFKYQAKWSRERVEYVLPNMNITLDKNAGYGYLSEFEAVIGEDGDTEATRKMLMSEIESFGLEELPQERIERMFAYYNEHWPEYYGTDKTFTIN